MKIGVLALQGDFDAHRVRLEQLGAEVTLVRDPAQLEGLTKKRISRLVAGSLRR